MKFRSGLRPEPKSTDYEQVSYRKGNTICNLCRQKANLTYDHVPPQCCGNDKLIVARRIYADEMKAQQVDARSHNGLKYRTLCKPCNADLGKLDDALGEFTKMVEPIVNSSIVLRNRMTFKIRAAAVLRSVLGHVVAVKTEDDDVPLDQKVREYLAGAPLDASVKVYCWLYPYRPIIVARDFTFVVVEGAGRTGPGLVSVIKFFPLAFCIVDGKRELEAETATALHPFSGTAIDSYSEIELWRSKIIDPGWPEKPMGNHIPMGGRAYFDAVSTGEPAALAPPGKRVQAIAWPGGDKADLLKGMHVFAETIDPAVPRND